MKSNKIINKQRASAGHKKNDDFDPEKGSYIEDNMKKEN